MTGTDRFGGERGRASSLSTEAARNLATTTKSAPQMQGITSRWLLRILPWVRAAGGVYRVNRRLSYAVGDGRVSFVNTGAKVSVIPQELAELPLLQGFGDEAVLAALAGRFVQREFAAGELLVEAGKPADQVFLLAHGKAQKLGQGKYGEEVELGLLTGGDHFGDEALLGEGNAWSFGVRAVTRVIALTMAEAQWKEVVAQSAALGTHVAAFQERLRRPRDSAGEREIAMSAGHRGEVELPTTFVDYELSPREYELSAAQTVLRVHSRVADLYNEPMNQTEQQLRLTIEALRERQEHELVNNPEFGLLHNADLTQRIPTRSGPPTPDDLDDLLSLVWKEPTAFLAHPKAIAAFGQECSRRGIYPDSADLFGHQVPSWRGVPILPCSKIPVSRNRTSSILLLRAGEQNQGVIGLQQTGIPDEVEPSLSVRFMGIDDKAVLSYLVTAYYSAAVLVPDALGVLEDAGIGHLSPHGGATMTESKTSLPSPSSLSVEAARNLATTTKSAPQMQGITPRWLLRMLPWVHTPGGVYRVNRRLSYAVGDGRVSFVNTGAKVSVIPQELAELPLLQGFGDEAVLAALAGRFVQREFAAGELLVEAGKPADQVFLLAHGKAQKLGQGKYGEEVELGLLTGGDHFGDEALLGEGNAWSFGVRAVTRVIALTMAEARWKEVVAQSAALGAHAAAFQERRRKPQDKYGQAEIAMSAGHRGEVELPTTFVDYELSPREYELSAAQTVLRVHSRVADLYNEPMNQTEQQLRLTIEALRERQEHELVNNPEFGLLHNADLTQRIPTRSGPPTPDDLDDLLCRRRGSRFFLAHPKAIAAFGRECTKRSIYPQIQRIENTPVIAWRGVPIFPCDKLFINNQGTTSILVMRTGVEEQGVIGLQQTGIPDEVEPSLSVRFMGIDDKAVLSYLVTAYYSAAVLVPDALGVLEDVTLG